MIKHLVFLSTIIILPLSCHKDDGLDEFGLPKPTQEGRGTFTILMNGQKWEPCVTPCLLCPPDPKILSYNYGERSLYLEAKNTCDGYTKLITIYADSIGADNKPYRWGATIRDFAPTCDEYFLDTNAANYLIITKFENNVHGIIAGEFEFYFINQCGLKDTIKMEGGRFDIRTDF